MIPVYYIDPDEAEEDYEPEGLELYIPLSLKEVDVRELFDSGTEKLFFSCVFKESSDISERFEITFAGNTAPPLVEYTGSLSKAKWDDIWINIFKNRREVISKIFEYSNCI